MGENGSPCDRPSQVARSEPRTRPLPRSLLGGMRCCASPASSSDGSSVRKSHQSCHGRNWLSQSCARSTWLRRSPNDGKLTGSIRIPNAVGPIVVTADLRAGQVTCHVDIEAPKEGRPATRVKWLLRQMPEAFDGMRVEAFAMHTRGAGAAELLRDVRENPLLLVSDPTKELRSFRVAVSKPLGSKRGRGRGSFIDSVTDAINAFYGEVVQNLKAWRAAPPQMRSLSPAEVPDARLTSTALSSQDGVDERVSEQASGGPTAQGIEGTHA